MPTRLKTISEIPVMCPGSPLPLFDADSYIWANTIKTGHLRQVDTHGKFVPMEKNSVKGSILLLTLEA
jgi:hypothetical protein